MKTALEGHCASSTRFEQEWRKAQRSKWRSQLLLVGVLAGLAALSAIATDFSVLALPQAAVDATRYFWLMLPERGSEGLAAVPGAWLWNWRQWAWLLLDTLAIAFLATLWGFLGAALLSVPGSHNLNGYLAERVLVRRFLELARTVPELVFALVFVVAFGLGPLAGVLAIGLHSLGAMGKLFIAVNENIDMGPVASLAATGANRAQQVRYAVFPQVLPSFLSYGMLRFEVNVRSASVIGLVGVGGIGQELYFVIRQFLFEDVGAILLMLLTTVFVIDMTGSSLRRMLGAGGLRG
ncbi:MAG: phosphonate ABC transporter, permease protein PhnE [Bryobacterales bacterium]|nr:phosphonate ABC transporter, permease protein PhnE [Bryobacterales bacterium]